jgi:hypothetical protein
MFKNFNRVVNLKYGLSKKSDKAMELAMGDLTHANNRRRFFEQQGIDWLKIVSPKQIHSATVVKVGDSDRSKIIPDADGLVTAGRDVFLTVTVADCFPVYFFDPVSNTIGLAHSGWRGTVANISGETAKALAVNPANLIAGIGPGIQACHFEIKEDILEKFDNYPEAIINRGSNFFVDLPLIIKKQLITAGLKSQNIENCGECTYCLKEKYFSFRRDKPENVEAMVAYIGIRL